LLVVVVVNQPLLALVGDGGAMVPATTSAIAQSTTPAVAYQCIFFFGRDSAAGPPRRHPNCLSRPAAEQRQNRVDWFLPRWQCLRHTSDPSDPYYVNRRRYTKP